MAIRTPLDYGLAPGDRQGEKLFYIHEKIEAALKELYTENASARMIKVGPNGGRHSTISQAVADIVAAGDAGPSNPYCIQVLPGTQDITLESSHVDLPPSTGLDVLIPDATNIICSGALNIRYGLSNWLKGIRMTYSGSGANSGGIRSQAGLSGAVLHMDDVNVDVIANHRSGVYFAGLDSVFVRGGEIRSTGIGIENVGASVCYMDGTKVWITGEGTGNPKICYKKTTGGRVFWRGAHYGTGYTENYNPPITNCAADDIAGIYCDDGGGGRFEVSGGQWTIVRNAGNVNAGVVVANIWAKNANSWIRVHDGYMQTEIGGTDFGAYQYDLYNEAGRFDVYQPVRFLRSYGFIGGVGHLRGMRTITGSFSVNRDQGGYYNCDTTSGNVIATLDWTPSVGDEFMFIRATTGNTITIDGNGTTINGASTYTGFGAAVGSYVWIKCTVDEYGVKRYVILGAG